MLKKAVLKAERRILEIAGVHFLSVDEVNTMVEKVAEKVTSAEYNPDVVVGIMRGGYLPSKRIASLLEKPIALIDVSRQVQRVMGFELDELILIPKLLGIKEMQPIVKRPFPKIDGIERALLVDDDCGTGKTFQVTEKELYRTNPHLEQTRTAVLLRDPESNPQPDFYAKTLKPLSPLIKRNFRFPWKPYSPHLEEYKQAITKKQE